MIISIYHKDLGRGHSSYKLKLQLVSSIVFSVFVDSWAFIIFCSLLQTTAFYFFRCCFYFEGVGYPTQIKCANHHIIIMMHQVISLLLACRACPGIPKNNVSRVG